MKWKAKNPKENDTRVIKRFLLFPRRINDEVRWLETVYIKQKYKTRKVNSDYYFLGEKLYWKDLKFIKKDNHEKEKHSHYK